MKDATRDDKSIGEGLYVAAPKGVHKGTQIPLTGMWVAANPASIHNYPVYKAGRKFCSNFRRGEKELWYLIIDERCSAGYINSYRGTNKRPNAKITVNKPKTSDELRATVTITEDLREGEQLV